MLLGSFVEEFDKDEGDDVSSFGSLGSSPYTNERTISPVSSHGDGTSSLDRLTQSVHGSDTGHHRSREGSGSLSFVNR